MPPSNDACLSSGGRADSVVVDYLDLFWPHHCPAKHDSVSIVDANAVLPFAVALERLQSVRRRNAQETDIGDRVQLFQLAPGNTPDLLRARSTRRPRVSIVKHIFGSAILEGPDHVISDLFGPVTK